MDADPSHEREALDYFQACRWLDAHEGARVAVSLFGPELGVCGVSPLAVHGLLQPGVVMANDVWGPGRSYSLSAGSGLSGSFWLGEEVLVGPVKRYYRNGSPSLTALMAFGNADGQILVSLCIEVTDAAQLSVAAEAEGEGL